MGVQRKMRFQGLLSLSVGLNEIEKPLKRSRRSEMWGAEKRCPDVDLADHH